MPRKRKETEVTDENAPENRSPRAAKSSKSASTPSPSPSKGGKKRSAPATPIAMESITTPKSSEKKKRKKKGEEVSTDTDSLFDALLDKSASKTKVEEWRAQYSSDKIGAMASLINFIIKSCGCDSLITKAQLQSEKSIETLLKSIISSEYLQGGTMDYPIISKKAEFKKFKERYLDFWNKFITNISNKILFDKYFMETLSEWLTAFSNLKARPFRHTATVTALQIVSSLITNYSRFRTDLESFQRQLKTEKKKEEHGTSRKIKQLAEHVDQYHQFLVDIEEMMTSLFKQIFVQRYRDISPDIRTACISALGSWIIELPTFFLDDHYLKYIGWSLYARVAEVRECAFKALEQLYKREDLLAQLNFFTQRFKSRIVEATADIDPAVSRQAIQLCTLLAKTESLDEEQKRQVFQLITDDNCSIRHEAAEFVKTVLFESKPEKSRKDKFATAATAQVKTLLKLITEYSLTPELPNYVVDALWSRVDVLTNYSAMTDMLQSSDASSGVEDTADQLLLVRLMVAAIKKAVGKSICPKTKQDPDVTQRKNVIENNQKNITKHFVKVLPRLLKQFQAEADIIEELIQVPQCWDLPTLSTEQSFKSHFKELFVVTRELYEHIATSAAFMQQCAVTFKYLKSTQHDFIREVEVALLSLKDDLSQQLNDAESAEAKQHSLTRIEQLGKQFDLTDMQLYDAINTVLESKDTELIPTAMNIMYQHMMWSVFVLAKQKAPAAKEIKTLCAQRDRFISQLDEYISAALSPEIALQAFLLIQDMLLLFSRAFQSSETLYSLYYEAADDLRSTLQSYFTEQMQLTSEEEDKQTKEKLVASVSRSIVYGTLPTELAPSVLIHFLSYGKLCSDLIKTLLHKLREQNENEEWKLILATLTTKYEMGMEDSANRQQFKELALRLAQSYGINPSDKLTTSLYHLIWYGMKYALEAPAQRFPFLEDGLSKFVSKLSANSASKFLAHCREEAQTKLGRAPSEENDEDKPFLAFLKHLETQSKTPKKSTRRTVAKSTQAVSKFKPLELESTKKPVSTVSIIDEHTQQHEPEQEQLEAQHSPAKKQKKKKKSSSHEEEEQQEEAEGEGEEEGNEEEAAAPEEEEEELVKKSKKGKSKRKSSGEMEEESPSKRKK